MRKTMHDLSSRDRSAILEKCFGELGFFQQLLEFLGLRTAFKLRSSGTILASMVSGSFVKNEFEMDRLLCQLAMEEFVKQWQCEDRRCK